MKLENEVVTDDSNEKKEKSREQVLEERRIFLRTLRSFILKTAFITVTIFILLSYVFGFQIHEGENMHPSIKDGDVLLYYRLEDEYSIGDVIIYNTGEDLLIGRVVGRAGDVIDVSDNNELIINEYVTYEEYVYTQSGIFFNKADYPYTVSTGEYFILLDNRNETGDSRSFGGVPIEAIEGRVFSIVRKRGI